MLNAARATGRNCGTTFYPAAGPLAWSTTLEAAALAHSTWMQQTNTFSHTGANGSTVATRVTAAGYNWTMVGENIAAGQPTLASVMQAWLNSPGHCANIMDPRFAAMGIAFATNPDTREGIFWTQVFATAQ